MTGTPCAPAHLTTRGGPARVRLSHVEHIAQRLSTRDRQIMDTVHRLRLATGNQLERLHFADLSPASRGRTRRRVLNRLVSWRVLATLPRRVGGVRAGSTGLIYHLDTAGNWLMRHQTAGTGTTAPRRTTGPSPKLATHTLAISELYVQLAEHARTGAFRIAAFETEPACWWPNTAGGQLKPDAHTLLTTDRYQDCWWIEIDLATETLPRIKKKLLSYLDFAHQGGTGPTGVLPRILITTPTAQRCTAVTVLITALPPPADQLFHAVLHQAATDLLLHTLLNP
jgi:hypothetical protein